MIDLHELNTGSPKQIFMVSANGATDRLTGKAGTTETRCCYCEGFGGGRINFRDIREDVMKQYDIDGPVTTRHI